jgi:collagenase-like PrtC family protease
MELLAPAGNPEKLYYAYTYGADAAYIGIGSSRCVHEQTTSVSINGRNSLRSKVKRSSTGL